MATWLRDIVAEIRKRTVAAIVAALFVGLGTGALLVWGWLQDLPIRMGAIPSGAVVAFTIRSDVNDDAAQCPTGWTPLREARGRFIVGAGVPEHADLKWWVREGSSEKNAVSTYQPFDANGEERHILTLPQLPNHVHGLANLSGIQVPGESSSPYIAALQYHRNLGAGFGAETQSVGEGQAFNLLPPYLALYYCRKV